jgi:hypothetical protein
VVGEVVSNMFFAVSNITALNKVAISWKLNDLNFLLMVLKQRIKYKWCIITYGFKYIRFSADEEECHSTEKQEI